VALSQGKDSRLANALQLIRARRNKQGRWAMAYDYGGKTSTGFGPKGQPNPSVTLPALKGLQEAG
jgi:hypothetical protein